MKSMLRGKFIAHSALIKNLERPYMSNLTIHMNALNQREANKCKRNRHQEGEGEEQQREGGKKAAGKEGRSGFCLQEQCFWCVWNF